LVIEKTKSKMEQIDQFCGEKDQVELGGPHNQHLHFVLRRAGIM